jgi:hypothetical protein
MSTTDNGWLWVLGVGLEVISTLCGTVGKQLIRFSELHKRAAYGQAIFAVSRISFYSGLLINTILGPILDMCAYAFAPAVLIAPFGGLDIVWNMLLAPCTLGEHLTFRRILSILLVFGGTTGSVFSASHTEYDWTNEYLHSVLVRWRTIIYLCALVIWCQLVGLLTFFPKGHPVRGFGLGVLAGSLAGNMFCVKVTAELIKRCFEESSFEPFNDWLPWVVLVGAVFFAVSNIVFMTKGLREFEALFMVTLFEGTMIVVNAVSAIAVLGEMDNELDIDWLGYALMLLIIISGVVLLTTGEKVTKEELSDSSEYAESDAESDSDVFCSFLEKDVGEPI